MNPIKMDANAIGKVISSYPRIEKAIVTIDKNQNGSEYEIIAYYITSGQPIELSELQHFLHDKLEPSWYCAKAGFNGWYRQLFRAYCRRFAYSQPNHLGETIKR